MHGLREYVDPAGLMSYGPSIPDLFRRTAEYVDKILRGAKPGVAEQLLGRAELARVALLTYIAERRDPDASIAQAVPLKR